MNEVTAVPEKHRIVVSAEQIQKRVREMARQISDDYDGKKIYAVCVLENGFMFMADLVRSLEVPVICEFLKPYTKDPTEGKIEIFFSPEVDVSGGHVLLIDGLMQSGVTSEFLMRNLVARGAASVKLAVLLDRQSARRVSLQPDYFGFLIDESYIFGYGMGAPEVGRNLPYVAATTGKSGGAQGI